MLWERFFFSLSRCNYYADVNKNSYTMVPGHIFIPVPYLMLIQCCIMVRLLQCIMFNGATHRLQDGCGRARERERERQRQKKRKKKKRARERTHRQKRETQD